MKQNLDTKTVSFTELIGNGRTFVVPRFQRDYSWEQDHWEDLWYDICDLETEKFHFMGYIVLQQTEDEKNFVIIDGQQRLTTLSIIALAIIKILEELADNEIKPENNRARSEALRNTFIGYKDPASLVTKSKLVLNRNNDDHYQSYIIRLRKKTSASRLKPSEKLMSQAFDYFYEAIKKHFENNLEGEILANFLNHIIADYLCFTTIAVNNEVNAYKVFETLNARGVRLSTTDLLKNLLFSMVSSGGDADIDQAERQWQSINNTLGKIDFPTYLRHFWNSRFPLSRQQSLFKDIKGTLQDSVSALSLLDDLENMADIYAAFRNPEDDLWRDDKLKKKSIEELKLFNVRQCYSLLLSAKEKLDNAEFIKLLKYCVVISFRYSVIGGMNPNNIEVAYNKVAQKIFNGELTQANVIFENLNDVYIDDRTFKSTFASKSINAKSKKRLVRYILFSLENYMSNKTYDFDDGKTTIEHILPDSPTEEWEKYFDMNEYEQYSNRLGNYTLLDKNDNDKCGQKDYPEKLKIYLESTFTLSKNLQSFDIWNPKALENRQSELAEKAAHVWRVDI
ncbi:MAG: DUF262 domain-containing protein [Sedimentisphaerales bacterium]|nr:DUF262 domain-containing protein [Sedimentisphaerales bacterium]